MKYPSDHLYKLIKSLTKSEKRHFKALANSTKNQGKYLMIFEAIDSQESYDEKRIKKQFETQKWVQRFNSAKEYLNKALMESLIGYNRKNESQYSLDSLLLSIRILQKKGFYDRCSFLIEKGKKQSRELDDFKNLLALLELESLNHASGINPYNSDEILDEQHKALNLLQNEYEYNRLYKESFRIIESSGHDAFSREELQSYTSLINKPLLKDYSRAHTFNAKRQFINMHYFYNRGVQDYDKMHEWILKAVQLFEHNKRIILRYPLNYATTLLNLQSSYEKRTEYEKSFEALRKLRHFYPRHLMIQQDRLTFMVDYASLHHEITLLNKIGEFSASAIKLPTFIELSKLHRRELSADIVLQQEYLMAYTLFGNNNNSASKKHIENIISQSNLNIRRDLHKKSRLLLMMIYYESKDLDLLEYTIRSTLRFFVRNEMMSELDKVCFKLFKQGLNNFENSQKLYSEVQKIKAEFGEKLKPVYGHIVTWIESKQNKVSLAEFIKGGREKN